MIAIYNTEGDLQCKYNYDAWGNHRIGNARNELIYDSVTGVIASGYESHIAILNPIRYRGYYYDTETGLYYLQSRYYDATLCRFLNRDNVNYLEPESIHGLNLYAYCNNNPVIFADPSGNEPKWWNPFSWFDNVSNTLKIIIGAAALAVAIFLTVATGGALLPLMVSFVVGVATSAAIGGLISTVKGESFWDGAYDGFSDGVLWGGIFALVAASVSAIKALNAASKGVTIGKNMDRVSAAAPQFNTTVYKEMKGYNLIKRFSPKLARKLSVNHNRRWIRRMMRLNARIIDIGLGTDLTCGIWYGMELAEISKAGYPVIKIMF